MTLIYENETIDEPSPTSAPRTAAWIAPLRGRKDKARGAALAALAGTPISSRFCSWIGLSGRRYVFSVYPGSECPAFCDAVLLAAIRDMTGERRAVLVRDTGA